MTRGVGWNLLAAFGNQGSTFAANVILANVLGLAVFGEYATVQNTLVVLSMLGQLGLGYTAIRYIAEFRTAQPQRAGRLLGLLGAATGAMATVVALGVGTLAPWMATDLFRAPSLTVPLQIGAGILFFNIVNGFLMGALAGLESYAALGRVGLAGGVVYLAGALGGAWLGGVSGALIGIAFSAVIQSLLLWLAVTREARRQGIRIQLAAFGDERFVLSTFALPAALNGLVAMSAIWFGSAYLVQQAGVAAMALFTAANSFRIIVLFVPNIVNNVNMSVLSHQRGVRDRQGFRRLFWMNFAVTAGVVLAGALGFAVLGQWLLLIFGPEFTAAYPVLLVMMLVTIPESLSLALLQIVQSQERLWFTFWFVTVPSYGTLVIAAYALVPAQGAVGLAWAYLAAWSIALVAYGAKTSRLGVEPAIRDT